MLILDPNGRNTVTGRRFGARVLLLAGLLILGGCSAMRMGYERGPLLAYWWLDDYLDFTDTQAPRVRAALDTWFAWHRTSQLVDYAELLARWRRELPAATTAATVCRHASAVDLRIARAADAGITRFAPLSAMLEPHQLARLAARFESRNAELREEYASGTATERAAALETRLAEGFEAFYGRLDARQNALIARAAQAGAYGAETWLAERVARQADTLAVLAAVANDEAAAAPALRQLIARLRRSPRPAYEEYRERLMHDNCRLVAAVHNVATGPQRARAARRLARWETDLRALAARAAR